MEGLSRHMGRGPWSHSVGHTHKHTPLSSRWASGQGEAVSQNLPLTPIPKRFAHKMAERPACLGWESACTPRARAPRTQAHALSDTTHDVHVHRGQPEATGPDPGQELPEHQAWGTNRPSRVRAGRPRQQPPSTWVSTLPRGSEPGMSRGRQAHPCSSRCEPQRGLRAVREGGGEEGGSRDEAGSGPAPGTRGRTQLP